jgi:cytosine/creatinine deaminase
MESRGRQTTRPHQPCFLLAGSGWNMTQERIDTCSELDVAILTRAPPSRDVPFVKRLPATSVRLGAGVDDCRGSSGPCGNGDMLERAMLRTNADAA